jgi:YidC/Oxa1 family membrane protein insertase
LDIIGPVAELMKVILDFLFKYTNSYGLSIIALTVIIKIVLFPLTYKQLNSMKKMQEIAPLQKKLQEKYKNDKERLNREIMELYRKNNVNPAGGCLPLLIQFPFLIALFRLLQAPETYGFVLSEESLRFLWIANLNKPDAFYILPILAGVTTYIQSKMTTTDPSQSTMTIVMSFFIAWMSSRFAAGLALYWVVSNVFQIAQQFVMSKSVAATKEGTN